MQDEWVAVRPAGDEPWESMQRVDLLIPDSAWLWDSLAHHCVTECCGLNALERSEEAVRWARGDDMAPPEGDPFRVEHPGDAHHLAEQFRRAAASLRPFGDRGATSTWVNEILTCESYADLFDDLARKLDAPAVEAAG